MLFLVFCDRSCCLMNPSTGGATPQQISLDKDDMDQRYHSFDRISKVVVSDKIVALIARDKVKIFARGPPQGFGTCSAKVWEPPGETHVVDIAIFKEKLYVLAAEYGNGCLEPPELHALDTCDEQAAVSSVQCVSAHQEITSKLTRLPAANWASSSTWSHPAISCCWWNGRSTWITGTPFT